MNRLLLWVAVVVGVALATGCALAGIWTTDDRWANTAWLIILLTCVPAVVIFVTWLEE